MQTMQWLAWLSSLLATTTLANYVPFHNKRYCGTAAPSPELTAMHRWLHDNEPLDNDLWNATTLVAHQHMHSHHARHSDSHKRQASNPYYTIDTYFHVVADTNSSSPANANYVTDAMIANQFTYLAQAYTNASIAFRLRGITRSVNNTWAAAADDTGMKLALRAGTYSTLNVYFQSQLQSTASTPGVPAGSTLLGFCTLPAQGGVTAQTPPAAYVSDGCNILSSTMPGGTFTGYNLGGTTAHEVGHWNGLYHPFQDNTCDPADYGDYIADTPQEMTSTNSCPASKDTCPNSGVPAGSYTGAPGQGADPYGPSGYAGPDPIHNFMDYSDDECYTGFTPGQGARMLNMWQVYRMGL